MLNRYLVLGTGVGRAIAFGLLSDPDAEEVVIADNNVDRAIRVANWLSHFFPTTRITGVFLDASAEINPKVLAGFKVVISALPARLNFEIARASIYARTNYCDLGGVLGVTNKITTLNRAAVKNGVSIVPDCGLMPGLGNMLARLMIDSLDSTETVEIYVGGLPQKPKPPLFYQSTFSLEGLRHLCYDPVPVLRNGEIVWENPFSGYTTLAVEALRDTPGFPDGNLEAFLTAGTSLAPWTFKDLGVRNFFEKTLRWPGFVEKLEDVPKDRFEEVMGSFNLNPISKENPDLVLVQVLARGSRDGRDTIRLVSFMHRYDEKTGLSAMEWTTGIPTAIVARMIARGQTKKGVVTPECIFTKYALKKYMREVCKHIAINITG